MRPTRLFVRQGGIPGDKRLPLYDFRFFPDFLGTILGVLVKIILVQVRLLVILARLLVRLLAILDRLLGKVGESRESRQIVLH